ncbi:MAG TPA: ATP-binding cassette domain-containing protein [Candidatus Saccharimonadales bacterium]|nr:ATP-binding cassette domain-containing protein [Candidatus Saccharimonadales bacterium]
MTEGLLKLRNVDVALGGKPVLHALNWEMQKGENWAILGGNGSGKSTFLKLVRGELWPAPGSKGERLYFYDEQWQRSPLGMRDNVGFLSPEMQERNLQQEWTLTVEEVLLSGFFNSDYLPKRPISRKAREQARSLASRLQITPLLKRNVQQLSTGELRRVLIGRALVSRPMLLVLDEVCDGLDAQARAGLLEIVEEAAAMGTQLLFTTHRFNEVPRAITHVAIFQDGRIVKQGPRHDVLVDAERTQRSRKYFTTPKLPLAGDRPLITIEAADVFLERKKVLKNITWQLRADQNWVIFGRNGAGKSTLLKLAFGDLHPAWGARLRRFEFTAKNTIWDLRKKVGFISPELQANYREEITGAQVVASGFFSSVGLMDRISPTQKLKVEQLLRTFGLITLGKKSALQMSYGEFRKMLLLRALVQNPSILVCDEPFDGLDANSKGEFSDTLERVSKNGTRLVLTTHHLDDLPSCISHGLLLENGSIVCQGELRTLWKHPALSQLFGPG